MPGPADGSRTTSGTFSQLEIDGGTVEVPATPVRVLNGRIRGGRGILAKASSSLTPRDWAFRWVGGERVWTVHVRESAEPPPGIRVTTLSDQGSPMTREQCEQAINPGNRMLQDMHNATVGPDPEPVHFQIEYEVDGGAVPDELVFDVWVLEAGASSPEISGVPATMERIRETGSIPDILPMVEMDDLPPVTGGDQVQFQVFLQGVMSDGQRTPMLRGSYEVPPRSIPGCLRGCSVGEPAGLGVLAWWWHLARRRRGAQQRTRAAGQVS